jgi:molybdopterin synthase sulfur carrier subunit
VRGPQPLAAHTLEPGSAPGGHVCVRFWASARAAAGVPEVVVPVAAEVALDTLVGLVLDRLPDRDRLRSVLEVCSVLVGDRPAGAAERSSVRVPPGSTVEFLPPFAGG